ncbi:L-threonylcarbamoyladenylate synthase [Catenuloplanes atrovinosus]|uniref:L-threonylcarbamoyladenylate synthase n=1 Tax=Catenuloplanes atrovinosus TaxID=137266 RepID=A0AAE3YWK4_9ACTN|nr:L-threonylcarbamoyladenylate synthase [Catenuloplanes atrovinosus]MDR7281060.1 L-threonylcarbamoyladenylate synthase [Catenuloplanes atrovinosus]
MILQKVTDVTPEIVAAARDSLLAGGVALVPTDTVYGLAAAAGRPEAAARIFALKNRPAARNLPIMVSGVDQLPGLGVVITPDARKLLDAFAPGPITIAFGVDPAAAPEWLAGREEVAVRIPREEALLAIIRETGPLLVTSANAHAQETPETVPDILAMLDGEPDVVLDGGPRQSVPSTLVNCNLPAPRIERAGQIPADQIEKVLS